MTRALFVTFDAGGNVPPMLGIAQRLQESGGEALVLGNPDQQAAARQIGATFVPFAKPQSFDAVRRGSVARGLATILHTTVGRNIARSLRTLASETQPDVVVVDCMLPRALAASIDAGYPTVTLVHSLPSNFAGPYAGGPIGKLSALAGASPRRVWSRAAATIATTMPGFDDGEPGPWAGLRTVGPIAPRLSEPTAAREPGVRPKVLISLSTIWYPGQDRTLQKLLDAIEPLDLDAVMTTGRSIDPSTLRAPANAEVHQQIDHDTLLPHVDLVVGHGGHGTAMRTLAHGLPMLVIPGFSLSDQPQVGQRIEATGAGRALPASTSVEELRAAIAELARPGAHRTVAEGFAARYRALDPAGAAVRVLGDVAAGRVPAQSSSVSDFSAQWAA